MIPKYRMRRPKIAKQGQALAFSLVFSAATALVCLMLYNSSTLATTKTQLQNAADAAAYSAAVLMARDHNLSAYTNRAMVANQVAVAQLVSMKSYMQDAANTHQRMRNPANTEVATAIPVFKPAWILAQSLPIEAVSAAYGNMAPTAVQALDRLIGAFDTGQNAYHQLTAANLLIVANEVVKRNDPKASLTQGVLAGTTLLQLNEWRDNETKRYRANDSSAPADRFANAVVSDQSTDEFVRHRSSTPVAAWISMPTAAACPGGIPVETMFRFKHNGGTILGANKRRWLALDASMGTGHVICAYENPTGIPIPVPYPLLQDEPGGSGGAVAGAGGGYDSPVGYANNPNEARNFGGALTNSDTSVPAGIKYAQGPGASLDGSGGLQDYYRDIGDLNTPANQSAALNGGAFPVTIEVEHKDVDIRTSSRVLSDAPATVKLPTAMKGGTMRALSSAHAYFYRPRQDSSAFTKTGWQREDEKTEMANLFSPYWQAQLVDRTEDKRLLSINSQ